MVPFAKRKVPLLFSKDRTSLLGEFTLEWCQLHWSDVSLLEYSYALLLFDQDMMAPQVGNMGFSHNHCTKCSCQATLWSLNWCDSSVLYGPAEDLTSALAKEGRSGSSSHSVWLSENKGSLKEHPEFFLFLPSEKIPGSHPISDPGSHHNTYEALAVSQGSWEFPLQQKRSLLAVYLTSFRRSAHPPSVALGPMRSPLKFLPPCLPTLPSEVIIQIITGQIICNLR